MACQLSDIQKQSLSNIKVPIIEKKKPGRPPNKLNEGKKIRLGIQNESLNPYMCFDMSYDCLEILKKVLNMYLTMSRKPMYWKIRKDKLTMLSKGKLDQNTLRIKFDGKKMHRYFAEQDIDIGISHPNVGVIHRKINSQYYNGLDMFIIDPSMTHEITTSSVKFKLKAPNYGSEDNVTLTCAVTYDRINDENFEQDDYLISFKVNSNFLKKKLNDADDAKATKIQIIQAGQNSPLTWVYEEKDVNVKSEDPLDSKMISLDSRISEDEIFSVDIPVQFWIPIAKSILKATDVNIYLSRNKPVLLSMNFDDNAVEVSILTDIHGSEAQTTNTV
jgi:hypothetical protein